MQRPSDAAQFERKIMTLLKRPLTFIDLRTELIGNTVDGISVMDLDRMLSSMKRSGVLTSGGLPLRWSIVDQAEGSAGRRPMPASDREKRNAAIRTAYGQPDGLTVTELAKKYGLSEASIWTITQPVRARMIQEERQNKQTPVASSLAAAQRGQDLVPGLRALAEHHRAIVDAAMALTELLEEDRRGSGSI